MQLRKGYCGLILLVLLFLNLYCPTALSAQEVDISPLWQIQQPGQIKIFPNESAFVLTAVVNNDKTDVVIIDKKGQVKGRFCLDGEVAGAQVIEKSGKVLIGFPSLPLKSFQSKLKPTGINLLITDISGKEKRVLIKDRWTSLRVLVFPIQIFNDKILLLWYRPYENTSVLEMIDFDGRTIWKNDFRDETTAKPVVKVYKEMILFYPGLPAKIEARNLQGKVLQAYQHFPFTKEYAKYADAPIFWHIQGDNIYISDAYGIKLSVFAFSGKKRDEILLDPYLRETAQKEGWNYSDFLVTSRQELIFAGNHRLVKISTRGKVVWSWLLEGEIQAFNLLPDDSVRIFWRDDRGRLIAGLVKNGELTGQFVFPETNDNMNLLVDGDYVLIFGDGKVQEYSSGEITKLISNLEKK